MDLPPASPALEKRITLNERRAFIVRNLRARGALSIARLTQFAPSAASASSLQGDIEFLNQLGFGVQLTESGSRRYLIDTSTRHIESKSERMDLNAAAKHSIAMAACALLIGIPDSISIAEMNESPSRSKEGIKGTESKRSILNRTNLELNNPELVHLRSRGELELLLRDQNLHNEALKGAVSQLLKQFRSMWERSNLSIFCDGGTTNDRMGYVLKDLFLPSSFSPLRNLFLCTNSRSLFNTMADPEVCSKAIITGGLQLGVDGISDVLAGAFTEAWLNATEGVLKFSVAFIGATAIVTDDKSGFALCDSFDEKTVKELVLSRNRSSLNVLCVDRSKFHISQIRDGYRFTALSPEQIDLIITSAASMHDRDGQWHQKQKDIIEGIRQGGVPILEVDFYRQPSLDETPLVYEMRRGKEIRCRLDPAILEQLVQTLGHAGSKDRTETQQTARVVELFLNAAIHKFLEDAPSKSACYAGINDVFERLENRSFIGTIRTAMSNDACPRTGTWYVAGNPSSSTEFAKGDEMPLLGGLPVVWRMIV